MEMSYTSWCAQCSSQFTQAPRSELIGGLLQELQKFNPLAEYDEHECYRLTHLYTEFLRRCKGSEHSLSLIQPGRFLIPGTFKGSTILQFFPLIGSSTRTPSQLEAASKNSYYKVFESRYKQYVKEVVIPFYKDFFKPMNRQIVLVDVINALNGGPAYIEDMRQALANISDAFSYGQNNLLTRLFSPKIDQVIFAATKVDQVVAKDHDAVRQLLASIVRQAMKTVAYEGVKPSIEAISSVRSSIEINDQGDAGISGLDQSGQPVGYIHPKIPSQIPNDADYELFKNWKIPLLNPAANGNYAQNNAIPHIRIDSIIELLIGDQ
jgi:predicted YcjX-like family ATPase